MISQNEIETVNASKDLRCQQIVVQIVLSGAQKIEEQKELFRQVMLMSKNLYVFIKARKRHFIFFVFLFIFNAVFSQRPNSFCIDAPHLYDGYKFRVNKVLNKNDKYYLKNSDSIIIKNGSGCTKFNLSGTTSIEVNKTSKIYATNFIVEPGDNIRIKLKENSLFPQFFGDNSAGNNLSDSLKTWSYFIVDIPLSTNNIDSLFNTVNNKINNEKNLYHDLYIKNKITKKYYEFISNCIELKYAFGIRFSNLQLENKKLSENTIFRLLERYFENYNPTSLKYRNTDFGILSKCIETLVLTIYNRKLFSNYKYTNIGLWNTNNQNAYNYLPLHLQKTVRSHQIISESYYSSKSYKVLYNEYNKLKILFPNDSFIRSIGEIYFKKKNKFIESDYSYSLSEYKNDSLVIRKINKYKNLKDIIDVELKNKNSLYFISFWATWCAPCKEDFEVLNKSSIYFKDNDITPIYISINKPVFSTKWKKNIYEFNLEGIHYYGTEKFYNKVIKELNDDGSNYQVPKYIIIDNDGKVLSSNFTRPSEENFENDLIELINSLD